MKARVCMNDFFGGGVEIKEIEKKQNVIISSESEDFSVFIEEVGAPGIKSIRVFPGKDELLFEIEQPDGWIIIFERGVYKKEHLIVRRFRRLRVGCPEVDREYLTTGGKWLPMPKGHGHPYPTGVMKIPLPE